MVYVQSKSGNPLMPTERYGKVRRMLDDGRAGEEDHTYDVPCELYDRHEYLNSGNSSFRRVIGTSNDTIVYESLYTKGCGK